MPRRSAALAALAAASILLSFAAHARAAPSGGPGAAADGDEGDRFACGKPKGEFALSFKGDVELRDLVAWAMGISCKRFLYASGLASRSAKLTMITPGTVTAAEAWSVFEIGLEAMGLTAVPRGAVYEIVESAQAVNEALAIRRSFPDGGGGVVRMLVRPKYADVESLRGALELVKSRFGVVSPLPALHAILVTDDGAHIARMKTLIDGVDQQGDGAGVYAIPVQHRDAAELVEVLTTLVADPTGGLGSGGGGGGASAKIAPRLSADRKVNAIFVAGSAGDYARVRAMVQAIDLPDGDDVHPYAVRLRNAIAKDVAPTLQQLLTGGAAQSGGGPRGEADLRIAADEGTNSLLFLANARDAIGVRSMIADLDAPRRQVYIEATVLEVEAGNTTAIGTSWHLGKQDGSGNTTLAGWQGSLDGSTLSSIFPKASLSASGLIGGLLGSALPGSADLLGQSIPSVGLLIAANTHTSDLHVLASPHLTAIDNKEAVISVGSNIPFKTSQGTTSSSLVTSGPSIDREDVALTLTITPHVAPADPNDPDADRIRLDIKLESKELGKEDFGDNLGPTWKERKLQTSVVLRDQDNLVLGGMIDERLEHTIEKIPVLGDVPVLGALFRRKTTVRSKSNLLIVLTPTLLDDSAAGRAVFDRRMREHDEFLRASAELAQRAPEQKLDYRRKRGLIAEIDAAVRSVDRDRAALAALHPAPQPSGRIDEVHDDAPAAPPQ